MIKHPLVIMLLIGVSSCIDFMIIRGLHLMFGLPAIFLPPKLLLAASLLNAVTGLLGFQIADRFRLKKEYA